MTAAQNAVNDKWPGCKYDTINNGSLKLYTVSEIHLHKKLAVLNNSFDYFGVLKKEPTVSVGGKFNPKLNTHEKVDNFKDIT